MTKGTFCLFCYINTDHSFTTALKWCVMQQFFRLLSVLGQLKFLFQKFTLSFHTQPDHWRQKTGVCSWFRFHFGGMHLTAWQVGLLKNWPVSCQLLVEAICYKYLRNRLNLNCYFLNYLQLLTSSVPLSLNKIHIFE